MTIADINDVMIFGATVLFTMWIVTSAIVDLYGD